MDEYTILISSSQGAGTDTNDLNYKFDWSVIPEGEYHTSFTFVSEPKKVLDSDAAVDSPAQAIMVEVDMPFSSNRYRVDTNGYANSSNVLGLIEVGSVDGEISHTNAFTMRRWKSALDNPSIKLLGKPTGQSFNIRLLKHNRQTATYFPHKYEMIIKFKKCNC